MTCETDRGCPNCTRWSVVALMGVVIMVMSYWLDWQTLRDHRQEVEALKLKLEKCEAK